MNQTQIALGNTPLTFDIHFSDRVFVIFPFSTIAGPLVEASVSSYATRPRGYGGQVVESRSLRLLL